MTTKIWITRTAPAAQRSAEAWSDAGFDPVIAPLLTVDPVKPTRVIADDAIIVFTSAHGVRHCGLIGDNRPVYCVGDATARTARERGFTSVQSGQGDWKRLLQIIPQTDQPIVHVSGETVRGELVEMLQRRGQTAARACVYRTHALSEWPLDVNRIDAVALYSPLAAEVLMALPPRHLFHVTAFCLSQNVAAPLRDMPIRIAAAPNERALIACSQRPDP